MAGETRIIAIGSNGTDSSGGESSPGATGIDETRFDTENPSPFDATWVEMDETASPLPQKFGLAPIVAALLVLAWTGFFGWANAPMFMAEPRPANAASLIVQWSMPVMMIGVGWLLVMRSSTREARRFGEAAQLLSTESALLEERLTAVNRELSLAREFIASQSRDLESLGRVAADRLSQNAERLQGLIAENGARVETIGAVSKAALDNMEKLRGQLPVIASSAKDVTNNIGNAGRAAHSQLEDMISGFNRLNEFGLASERQVATLRGAVDNALGEFRMQCEQLEVLAEQRFAALAERGAEFRTRLDQSEIDVLASIRSRASALEAEIAASRTQLDQHEAESLTSLRARLNALRDESDVVSRALRDGEARAETAWQETLAAIESGQTRIGNELAAAQDTALGQLRERLESIAEDAIRFEADLATRSQQAATELANRQMLLTQSEEQAAAKLAGKLAEIDGAMAARLAGHDAQARALVERAASVAGQLTFFQERLDAIADRSAEADSRLASSLALLAERLTSARATLSATDSDVDTLTEASVRLLELIQASAKLTHSALPEALAVSEDRLGRINVGIDSLIARLQQSSHSGQSLAAGIEMADDNLQSMIAGLAEAQANIAAKGQAHGDTLRELKSMLAEVEQASDTTAAKAQGELRDALAQLAATMKDAVGRIEREGSSRITALSTQLAEESGQAIIRSMRNKVAEVSGQLEQSVAHASGLAREATIQLRDQLAKVDELVGNLESRVAHARTRAEEQVDNDFSRRAALITESLNSNAIDIARALAPDVSDTAWSAYLRGDRGIFTRRAVSLLDAGEVKSIQQLFERDDTFREHVSRYIHDFEAMLRQVLSTRDGNALGVTLLSSDMGKLYVALAQGIERLRN